MALATDRMFFIVYASLAAAFLAALTWDALYPGREEHEVLGVLPLRPRTLAAARLGAALTLAVAFIAATSLPAALCFGLVTTVHPAAGFLPFVIAAHLTATLLAGMTAFMTLLVLRSLASIALGERTANGLATFLQFATVFALVEVFFYLPTVLPALVAGAQRPGTSSMWWPWSWSFSLYQGLAGMRVPLIVSGLGIGSLALTLLAVALVPLYLVPARLLARRALESKPSAGGGGLPRTLTHVIRAAAGSTPARTVASFATLTLLRSRRHLVLVLSVLAVGVAIALVEVLAAGLRAGFDIATPTPALLAVPLSVMLFLVAGLRVAFRVPHVLDANWTFRLAPPTAEDARRGVRVVLLGLGVAPVLLAAFIGQMLAGWPSRAIATTGLLNALGGALLVECLSWREVRIPFACPAPEGHDTVRTGWVGGMVPFGLFVLGGAAFETTAIDSPASTWAAAAGLAVAITVVIAHRRHALARVPIDFQEHRGSVEPLGLSEALH